MLNDHYAYAIEDLRRHGPFSADVEWRAARAAYAELRQHERASPPGMARKPRRTLAAWLKTRRELSPRASDG
jgi:hypothetical protein